MPGDDGVREWRPLNVRDTADAAEYDTLVEGIPEWLERSLWRWVMDRAVRASDLTRKAERLLRVRMPQPKANEHVFQAYWTSSGDEDRLRLIDFFLRDLQEVCEDPDSLLTYERLAEYQAPVRQLDEILVQGGSIWRTTTEPYWSLTRRVDETTRALVELVSTPKTDAARKITSAWHACYRHEPDYDLAYRDAVLAVEAVALPKVIPNNNRGTLGHVVSHLADTRTRWTVGLLDADQQQSGESLLAVLRTLWHNQQRHAQADGRIIDVGRREAEVAVSLAVTLVHWFAEGLVERLET
jgi:hypothetical protein